MITIERVNCPESLRGTAKAKAAYRNKDVVKTLWNMQHKKCAYCEADIPHEGHLKAVEHFRPKSIFKSRVNDWKNLLLVCAQCNGFKSDKFPVELTNNIGEAMVVYIKRDTDDSGLLIDPTDPTVDPEEHLDFVVSVSDEEFGMICVKNHSSRGRETVTVVGLDNSYYTRRHRKHISAMLRDLLLMLEARDQSESAMERQYKDILGLKLSAKAPLSGVARAFARENRLDVNFGVTIPTGCDSA